LLLDALLLLADRVQHVCQSHLVCSWEVVRHAAGAQYNALETLVCSGSRGSSGSSGSVSNVRAAAQACTCGERSARHP
jgi:hypothetical protein